MAAAIRALSLALIVLSLWVSDFRVSQASLTRHYKFEVKMKNVTRLCNTKTIATVNGKFPGPTIVAREGDRLIVKVVNHVPYNVSFHWHGVRQLMNPWADGPAYITQCPIQRNHSYTYNFTVPGQRGTLVWHAHVSWMRATLHGSLIILPKRGVPYPFPKPYKEVSIILGEWFKGDTEAIIAQALQNGGAPNVSDAYTINGLPGLLYNCSSNDTYKLKVKPGKTYMLRLASLVLNDDLFFSVANHTLTVVEADAVYTKPFNTNVVLISPGQTTNVLLHTNPIGSNATTFVMAARPYSTAPSGTFDNTTTTGILEYETPLNISAATTATNNLTLPFLPAINDTSFAFNFTGSFRSLAIANFPATVPQNIDRRFFFTVGLGTNLCPANQTCQGPNGTKFAASMNNISFILPNTSLLQAHYYGKSRGVYTADFPQFPPFPFNYTGPPPNNTNVSNGTKVLVLPYNTSVELVMQGTSLVNIDSHPMHLHGYNVFIVGQGFGNFDPAKDPAKFNLNDPAERNTVSVPAGGWVAVRFRADNPGVWLFHCHLEVHLSWGLRMALVVLDGKLPGQKLLPPPPDLPKC